LKHSFAKLATVALVVEVAILFISYLLFPEVEDTFRHAARYSGRLSAVLFLFVFFLYSRSYPLPLSGNPRVKKMVKLFALVHVIHWLFLAASVYLNYVSLETVKVIGGSLAYAMIVAAPFLLHQVNFKFQLVYFYYVSLVMILTWLARIKGDFQGASPSWIHYVLMGTTIGCCAYFGWQMRKKAVLHAKH
jgi:hypothetical protein